MTLGRGDGADNGDDDDERDHLTRWTVLLSVNLTQNPILNRERDTSLLKAPCLELCFLSARVSQSNFAHSSLSLSKHSAFARRFAGWLEYPGNPFFRTQGACVSLLRSGPIRLGVTTTNPRTALYILYVQGHSAFTLRLSLFWRSLSELRCENRVVFGIVGDDQSLVVRKSHIAAHVWSTISVISLEYELSLELDPDCD